MNKDNIISVVFYAVVLGIFGFVAYNLIKSTRKTDAEIEAEAEERELRKLYYQRGLDLYDMQESMMNAAPVLSNNTEN